MTGSTLLMLGLVVCAIGFIFGLVIYQKLKNLPVHKAMLEICELIYETCKTYLITQAKFIFLLGSSSAIVIVVYFGVLEQVRRPLKVVAIAGFSRRRHPRQLGRRVVRHPRQHVRELAHGVRGAARQAVPHATRSRSRPA